MVESCGGESKLGVLYIAAPRRLPRTGFSGEVITAALWLHGRVQRLSVVVGVPWFYFGANRVGIWLLRGSSTERGGAGPSAAGSMLCACRATATMLHACAGEENGHAESPGGLGGAEQRYAAVLLPVGRYGDTAAAKHAGAGGPGRHQR